MPVTPLPSRRAGFGSALDVVIIAMGASIAGLANDFANDDIELVARNVRVHDLAQWHDWLTLPYWPPPFSPDLYRPITTALLAIEYTIGAGSPLVFRIVSYVLYALACVGVYMLCARVTTRPLAFGAAALFAAHPVHVEAIALAVGQAEILTAICAVAMCVLYLDRRRNRALTARDWLPLVALYLVACLSKEQGIVIPALLLAIEFLFVPSNGLARMRSARGAIALVIVALLVLFARYRVLGSLAGTFTAEALDGVGITSRLLTMLAVVPQWMRLLLWPAHLQADYSPQEIVASTAVGPMEFMGFAVVVALAIGAWRLRTRAPGFTFGVLWCAITLAPVSNVIVVTGIVLAERTLFLPSVGAVLALAALAELMMERLRDNASQRRMIYAVAGPLVLLGVGRSIERQRVWRNDAFVVARTVSDAPKSFRNQRAFGDLMFDLDQPTLAHQAFERAIEYSPVTTVWRVRNSYARAMAKRGELEPAVEQFRRSLAQRPDQEFERAELAVAYLTLGRYEAAGAEADTALLRGGRKEIYSRLRDVADSAARAQAPPGSIRIGLVRSDARADR